MNVLAVLFLFANAVALACLPRRWAPFPLLIGVCYMTLGQGFDLGPFSFTVVRVLIAVGVVRVILRRESIAGGLIAMDWMMIGFGVWALITSFFHEAGPDGNPLVLRLGLVYNTLGIYFLTRIFCDSFDDLLNLVQILALLLVPVALEMAFERLTARNMFSVFGGVSLFCTIREGNIRAQGPFMHPILAGTVGAVCFPLMVGLWNYRPRIASIGMGTCLLMVFACGSSGPIMSMFAAIFALVMWKYRHLTRAARIGAVAGYVLLSFVMNAKPYYLLARIDISGGSTGWHRAELIDSSIRHLSEWWLAGTDYTRHWMPTGVTWSPNHTDITNYYLSLGVRGGLPLMMILIFMMWTAFKYVGRALSTSENASHARQFMIWSLGAALLAHAATCVSVSYFDQSYVFLYVNLALIGSVASRMLSDRGEKSRVPVEAEVPIGASWIPVEKSNPRTRFALT